MVLVFSTRMNENKGGFESSLFIVQLVEARLALLTFQLRSLRQRMHTCFDLLSLEEDKIQAKYQTSFGFKSRF